MIMIIIIIIVIVTVMSPAARRRPRSRGATGGARAGTRPASAARLSLRGTKGSPRKGVSTSVNIRA